MMGTVEVMSITFFFPEKLEIRLLNRLLHQISYSYFIPFMEIMYFLGTKCILKNKLEFDLNFPSNRN